MGKWSDTHYSKDGPWRPGKTQREKESGVWAQHLSNKRSRALASSGKK